jgi:hypothetical protein
MDAPTLPHHALPDAFRPAAGLENPHLQTLVGRWLRSRTGPDLRRERWNTADGDFVDLDFTPDPDPSAPLVVVLHGLEGNARRNYCLEAYRALHRHGIPAVGFNFRACSGEPNLRARTYHSGETDDLAHVLLHLRKRFPGRPLGLLGFSLGGNVALKYLGERGGESLAGAGVAISVPYDLSAGADHLEATLLGRHLYTRYFLRSLKQKVRDKEHLMEGQVALESLWNVPTIRRFDDLLTAPLHGFVDAEDYYRQSSSSGYLAGIRAPTLLLHSIDDPFLPAAAVPREAMRDNPWIHPVLTPRGGHVGFVTGSLAAPRFWAEASAARFLAVSLGDS